jgi:hypothetical protein
VPEASNHTVAHKHCSSARCNGKTLGCDTYGCEVSYRARYHPHHAQPPEGDENIGYLLSFWLFEVIDVCLDNQVDENWCQNKNWKRTNLLLSVHANVSNDRAKNRYHGP